MKHNKAVINIIILIIFLLGIMWFFFATAKSTFETIEKAVNADSVSMIPDEVESNLKANFPFNLEFKDIKGMVYKSLGKDVIGDFEYIKDSNGVVRIVSDGYDAKLFIDSVERLKLKLDSRNIPLIYVNLPDAGANIQGNIKINGGTPKEVVQFVKNENIDILDINEKYRSGQTPFSEEISFRTDFHYTTEGEFWIASEIAKYLSEKYYIEFPEMNKVFSLDNYYVRSYPFIGNSVRNLGKYFTEMDTFDVYHPLFDTSLDVFVPQEDLFKSGDFDTSVLNGYEERNDNTEYTYWVTNYGHYPSEWYTIYNNNSDSDTDILLICDSIFMRGSSYLSLACRSVTFYDSRVDGNSKQLSMLIDNNDFDAVLLIGSSDDYFSRNFANDISEAVESDSENEISRMFIDVFTGGNADNTGMILETSSNNNIQITGWAIDKELMLPLKEIYADVNGTLIKCNYGIQSANLVTYYGSEALGNCGFTVVLPKRLVRRELVDSVSFILVTQTDKIIRCRYSLGVNNMGVQDVISLPQHLFENSINGLWVNYANGIAQTEERKIVLDIQGSETVRLDGWAADMAQGTSLSGLFVRVGDHVFECEYGIREDLVAEFFQNENLRYTGFSVDIPAEYFTSDVTQLEFIEVSLDGSFRYEDVIYEVKYERSNSVHMDIAQVLALPVHSLDGSVNGLWIDYTNGIAQTEERKITLDISDVDTVSIDGWAGDMIQGNALGGLFVRVGDHVLECEYGIQSDIVAQVYQNDKLRYTGFHVDIPAGYFTSDITQIEFIEIYIDGSFRYEDVIYKVNITGASDNGISAVIMMVIIAVVFIAALFYLKNTSGIEAFQKFQQNEFLFSELIKRDFTLKYKRTILGVLWSMISPLVNLIVMWIVFRKLMGENINHYVIYLFSGQLVFNYFNEATTMGMTSLSDNSSIFTKVNVPKYLFLFSRNVASLINFGLTFIIYLIFVAIDGLPFTLSFVSLLYPILCMIILNLGIGLILSALFVFFRDMRYLWGIGTQIIMWLSVIFYSIDMTDPKIQKLFMLNPVYLSIKYFRSVVIDGTIPDLNFHLLMAFYSIGFFVVGCIIYKKKNQEFLYYV